MNTLLRCNGLALSLDVVCVVPVFYVVERAIRPIALYRKKALFSGRNDGTENCATIVSPIATCKLSVIYPQAWMADASNDHR